jgi:hypothetical protein
MHCGRTALSCLILPKGKDATVSVSAANGKGKNRREKQGGSLPGYHRACNEETYVDEQQTKATCLFRSLSAPLVSP